MRKAFAVVSLLLGLAAVAKADTYTPNFSFVAPSTGSTGWGIKLNNDLVQIDTVVASVASSGSATAAKLTLTAAATGQLRLDLQSSTAALYSALSSTAAALTIETANRQAGDDASMVASSTLTAAAFQALSSTAAALTIETARAIAKEADLTNSSSATYSALNSTAAALSIETARATAKENDLTNSSSATYSALNSTAAALTIETANRQSGDTASMVASSTLTAAAFQAINSTAAALTIETARAIATEGTKITSPTASGSSGYVLTSNGLDSVSWQPAATAAGLTYIVVSAASDISGYTQMVDANSYTPAVRSTTTATNPSVNNYISSRATNVGFPGMTSIPAGPYRAHIHALASNANRFKIKFEVYIRHANGVENEFLENVEDTPFLNTTETEYDLVGIGVSTNILVTDRIVYKIKVTVASGAGTVSIFCDGIGDSQTNARLEMPSVAASVTNFVPYTGATKAVDLGAYGITAANFTGVTITTSALTAGKWQDSQVNLTTGAVISGVWPEARIPKTLTSTFTVIAQDSSGYSLKVSSGINASVGCINLQGGLVCGPGSGGGGSTTIITSTTGWIADNLASEAAITTAVFCLTSGPARQQSVSLYKNGLYLTQNTHYSISGASITPISVIYATDTFTASYLVLDSTGGFYTPTCGAYAGLYVWIAVDGDNKIARLDTAGNVTTFTDATQPFGIAVDTAGFAYTVNRGSANVKKFSLSGSLLSTIALGENAYSIAVDSSNNKWVTNRGNRFWKISSTDGLFGYWHMGSQMHAIAIDSMSFIYTNDQTTGAVYKARPDGVVIATTVVTSSDFASVWQIAVDTQGYIITPDGNTNKIDRLKNDLSSYVQYTALNTGVPTAVAIAPTGHWWVSLYNVSKLEKFDSGGNSLGQFTCGANPVGIAVDASGNVYSASLTDNNVKKFSSAGALLGTYTVGTGPFSPGDMTGFALKFVVKDNK